MLAGEKRILADVESEDGRAVRKNFRRMTLCFAVNHSCATAPLVFASSVLDEKVGLSGCGFLYTFSIISSLLLSVFTVEAIGLRGGLVLSTALYAVYVGSFTLAAMSSQFLALQYPLFVVGSCLGGIGAGILWTAEGGYMARSASLLAECAGITRQDATSELAGDFAFFYLIFEVVGKLGFTCLQSAGLQVWHIGVIYTSLAVISMCLLTRVDAIEKELDGLAALDGLTVRKDPFTKLFAVVRLWRDPKIWLLSPTNITFGFSAAYLNGYFNATYEAPELGTQSLGLLTSVTVACAAVFSKFYGMLGQRFGKGVAITAGAASFAGIPILVLSTGCCDGFGWSMVIFYVLQGSGRAVYESTNKAVFSDFFVGDDTDGAFANCAMQMSVASAALFFGSAWFHGSMLSLWVLVSALLTPVAYATASMMKSYKAASPAAVELEAKAAE